MGQRRPGRVKQLVGREVGGPERGQEFLPAAHFGRQGDQGARHFGRVEVREEPDAVGEAGQRPQTGAALEINEQQVDPPGRVGSCQRSREGPEELRFA